MDNKHLTENFEKAAVERSESHAELTYEILDLNKRITTVEQSIADNTKLTAESAQGTAEILSIFKSVKGGFAVMGWLGTFAKWVASIVAVFAAIYAFVQNIRGMK